MLLQKMQLFATVTVLLSLLTLIGGRNSTNNDSECILTDIESGLNIASQIIETARQKLPKDLKKLCRKNFNCTEFNNKTHYQKNPVDCSDIYLNGERADGPYDIWPESRLSRGPLRVYCDMESNGGGWTVVQRRGDYNSPKDYFYQEWIPYKIGFGDILKDFWIGNDNLFALTNQRSYQLRINLSDWEGNSTYAIYDEFWTADELHNYTLHVKGYRGTAGDSLSYHDRCGFFTKDRDNRLNCAVGRQGAWWYHDCSKCNLNGLYERGETNRSAEVIYWRPFRGPDYSLKDTVMKIRPAGFQVKPSN